MKLEAPQKFVWPNSLWSTIITTIITTITAITENTDLGSLLSPIIVTVTGVMSTITTTIIITTAITGATGTKIRNRRWPLHRGHFFISNSEIVQAVRINGSQTIPSLLRSLTISQLAPFTVRLTRATGDLMDDMAVLENVRRYRTIASLYRQTAAFRPAQKWTLLEQAFEWERRAMRELETYFTVPETASAGEMASAA